MRLGYPWHHSKAPWMFFTSSTDLVRHHLVFSCGGWRDASPVRVSGICGMHWNASMEMTQVCTWHLKCCSMFPLYLYLFQVWARNQPTGGDFSELQIKPSLLQKGPVGICNGSTFQSSSRRVFFLMSWVSACKLQVSTTLDPQHSQVQHLQTPTSAEFSPSAGFVFLECTGMVRDGQEWWGMVEDGMVREWLCRVNDAVRWVWFVRPPWVNLAEQLLLFDGVNHFVPDGFTSKVCQGRLCSSCFQSQFQAPTMIRAQP